RQPRRRATSAGPRVWRRNGFSARSVFLHVWTPELAPGAPLGAWARSGPGAERRWPAFARRYRREMSTPGARRLIALLAALSGQTNFSIGCYCADESRCHRSLLRAILADAGARFTDAPGAR